MTAINRTDRSKNFLQKPGHPHMDQIAVIRKFLLRKPALQPNSANRSTERD